MLNYLIRFLFKKISSKHIALKPKRCHEANFVVYHDVIKWKHFPRYWPFVRGIHRLPVDSHHKGQWRGALMFSLTCAWTKGWATNGDDSDLITPSRSLWRHRNAVAAQWLSYQQPVVPIIALGDGLSLVGLQAITWTNAGLFIRPLGTGKI